MRMKKGTRVERIQRFNLIEAGWFNDFPPENSYWIPSTKHVEKPEIIYSLEVKYL